jgi:hypothetical protein
MRSLSILSTLILSSCATHWNVQDIELAPFYSSFVQEAELRDIDLQNTSRITVGFAETLPNNYIGLCRSNSYKGEVLILRSFWDRATYNQKLMLAYHEFSHCLCDLDHYDGQLNIMNTYLPNDWDYDPSMIDNLFNMCKANLKD